MNFFDLLKPSKVKSQTNNKISDFELKYKFNLPVIFKIFILNYDLANISNEKLLCYYNSQYDAILQMYDIKYIHDENISIENWIDLDQVIKKMKSIYNENDLEIFGEYIAIAESFDQGIILLGITESNKDQIFVEAAHNNPRIKRISSNIFDFLSDFDITLAETDLPENRNSIDLYKNWNEDFWRVRDDA